MERLCSAVVFLMMLSSGFGFSCTDEDSTFYYTSTSTDCSVYYLCHISKVTAFTCPLGQAFDTKSQTCRDALFFDCITSSSSLAGDQISVTKQAATPKPQKHSSYWKLLSEKLSKESFIFVGNHKSTNTSPFSDNSTYTQIFKSAITKRNSDPGVPDMQDLYFQYRLANNIILPLVSEIIQDQETKSGLRTILLNARSAYSSIASKMARQTNFRVSKTDADSAKNAFFAQSKSIVRRVADKNIFPILRRLSENVALVLEMIDRLKMTSFRKAEALKVTFVRFTKKHGDVITRSRHSHIDASVRAGIKREFQPIEKIMVQFFSEFLSQYPSSLVKIIYNRNSDVYKKIMA